jgi:undecaprenyl-diphosphatase
MSRLIRKIRAFVGRHEPVVFVAALLIVLGVWGFVEIFDEVREGDTERFDAAVLKAFRQAGDPSKIVGPLWVQEVIRDITALGGVFVVALITAAVSGFLWLSKRRHMLWLMLVSVLGATILNTMIKWLVDRPRPLVVPRLMHVTSESFPSGHSAMSAAVYLTLGALLAQTVTQRRLKLYFLGMAILLAVLVGISRVALGVHFPTDVLAGWATGLVWALACWVVARYLQRRGKVERPEDPTSVDQHMSAPHA